MFDIPLGLSSSQASVLRFSFLYVPSFYLFFAVGVAVYPLTFYPGRAPCAEHRMPSLSFNLTPYTFYLFFGVGAAVYPRPFAPIT
jgi:hypothetical protein